MLLAACQAGLPSRMTTGREVIPGICIRGSDGRDIVEAFNSGKVYIGNHPDIDFEYYDIIWDGKGFVKKKGVKIELPNGSLVFTSQVEPFDVILVGRPEMHELGKRIFQCKEGEFGAIGT